MSDIDKMVFAAAVAMIPDLFSTIPHEAHRAASPYLVEAARETALAAARVAVEAALAVAEPVAWDCVAPDGGRHIVRHEAGREPVGWASTTPLFTHPNTKDTT